MMHDDYDGFGVRILEEDGVLLAQFVEFPEIAACGATVMAALIKLKAVWEANKKIYIHHHVSVSDMWH